MSRLQSLSEFVEARFARAFECERNVASKCLRALARALRQTEVLALLSFSDVL
jgi:hypothetical protein